MKQKTEIKSNEIRDYSAVLDERYGKQGTEEYTKNLEKAYAFLFPDVEDCRITDTTI